LIRLDLVFRLLQLFMEGHNLDMQNLLRVSLTRNPLKPLKPLKSETLTQDQSSIGCRNSYNLLQLSVNYLEIVAKNSKQLARMSQADAEDTIRVLSFLIESVQGPCPENQELLAKSVVADICSYIIGFKISPKVSVVDRKALKGLAAKTLWSLLEGRGEDLVVQALLAQKLEATALRARLVTIHKEYLNLKKMASSLSHTSSSSSSSSLLSTCGALVQKGFEACVGATQTLRHVRRRLSRKLSRRTSRFGDKAFLAFCDEEEPPEEGGFASPRKELPEEVLGMLHDSQWDEAFLEEGFDLLKLADALSSPQSVASLKACKEFRDKLSLVVTPKPEEDNFRTWKDFEAALTSFHAEKEFAQALGFFHKRLRVVEIAWAKPGSRQIVVTEPMLFAEPSECAYMPRESRERIRNMMEYSSEDRIAQFLEACPGLIAEMQHLEHIGQYALYHFIGVNLGLVKWLGFMVSILMNLLLVICMVAPSGSALDAGEAFQFAPAYMGNIVLLFGFVQLLLGMIILGFILASRAPLVYKNLKRRRERDNVGVGTDVFAVADKTVQFAKGIVDVFRPMIVAMVMVTMLAIMVYVRYLESEHAFPQWYSSVLVTLTFVLGAKGARQYLESTATPLSFAYVVLFDILTDGETAFYCLYVVAAALGLRTPLFYCYHLMYLVVSSDTLQNVIRSVTQPFFSLSLTFILLFVVIYIFTMLYFLYQVTSSTHLTYVAAALHTLTTLLFPSFAPNKRKIDFGMIVSGKTSVKRWGVVSSSFFERLALRRGHRRIRRCS
jgi:hypothetical protein